MAGNVCPNCGGLDFDQNNAAGDLCCKNCGTVLEESRIVSEVTFGEASSGAAVVHGSFVAADQSHATGGGGLYGRGMDSREQTLKKGKTRIQRVAAQMRMPDYIAEMAYRHFALAVTNNFVKGRKSQYVVSACLYVACRKERATHMLIDFADALKVNVFAIGATYLKLVKVLGIKNLPLVDPSIYIQRFAAELQFGNKTKDVMNDAVRLVQRMGKDWLHEGRRPAGVAAACLYLAARMNNFRRSKAEIVFFAKIAEETLQRRLDEFKNTTAGKLSVQDFRGTNIESEADPPSFTKHRAAEEKMYEALEALEDLKRAGGPEPTNRLLDEDVQTLIDEVTRGETDIEKSINENNPNPSPLTTNAVSSTSTSPTPSSSSSSSLIYAAASITTTTNTTKSIVDSILRRHLHPEVPVIQRVTPVSQVNDHPEDLSDVDDDEIDSFVLNPEEVEIKSRVWMTLNRDYILEQERKRLKMEAEIANGTYKAPRKRRRHKPKDSSSEGLPKDASESTKAMLQQRTFSKKINYAAIDNLFKKEP